MPDGDRSKISVRSTHEYVAGFGTSGSLLAGAAVLFLVGSAIVAFRGWPQIATGPATSSVAAAPLALNSPVARRLAVVLAAVHRGAARGTVRRTAGHERVSVKAVQVGWGQTQPTGATGSTTGAGASAAGGSYGTAPSQCGNCQGQGSQGPVGKLTTAVTNTVTNVANSVGQQMTGLGSVAAGQVSSANPQAGSAVGSVSSSAANTVTNTVTTVTNVLGGGH